MNSGQSRRKSRSAARSVPASVFAVGLAQAKAALPVPRVYAAAATTAPSSTAPSAATAGSWPPQCDWPPQCHWPELPAASPAAGAAVAAAVAEQTAELEKVRAALQESQLTCASLTRATIRAGAERDATSKALAALEDRVHCAICLDAEKNVLFHPCRHVVSCAGCVSSLRGRACPLCAEPVNYITKFFPL